MQLLHTLLLLIVLVVVVVASGQVLTNTTVLSPDFTRPGGVSVTSLLTVNGFLLVLLWEATPEYTQQSLTVASYQVLKHIK